MRVGLFSNAYHPLINGVVNSLEGIRRGLLESGHQVHLFAPKVRGYDDDQPNVYRFASLEMSRRVSYPIPIPYSGKLFKMIRSLELDIIHAHHPILLGDVAASFAQQKQVPLVYTFHTQLEQYSHYIPLNQHVVKGMARSRLARYLNKCQLVIAPSDGVRGLLDSYGVKSRVVTLCNAIDIERFAVSQSPPQSWRRSQGISEQAVVSLSVGRLGQEKNLDFLLKSFAQLSTSCEHVLVLVGDGSERESLQQLARDLEVADRVKFTGAIPYADMPTVYAACDLFTICSTTEVKPLVVLEALASGLPVLAVAACGTADTLHHRIDGWLSPAQHAPYIEGWNTLIETPELRSELSLGARQTASAYSFDGYLRRLLGLYEETIEEYRNTQAKVGAGAV